MKILRSILTILIAVTTFQLFGQNYKNDTIFIHKDTVRGTTQYIFIDKNKHSEYYDQINAFNFGPFDRESYDYSLKYLKENNLKLTKEVINEPATKWITLKQYKNKFYVYHPCDFIYHYKISITDTTFIDWTGEGPVANKIIGTKKIDNKTYEFRLTGVYNQDRKLVIHIIDAKKGIAVFEQTTSGNNKFYFLMIAADKIRNVPIIVNYCGTEKQSELDFEEPDCIKLLKTK